MSFNSLVFLIYLPIVILIYFLLPFKGRWFFLLIASYFFYAYANPWLLLLISSTTLVSYLCSLGIEKTRKKGLKNLLFALALIFLFGMLFVFKYLDFAIASAVSLMNLFGSQTTFSGFHLLLPVGISFYTFQTLGYVIDVYQGKIKAERHLGYFALFVSFFPQLVAGPIERPQDLLPQLKEKHNFTLDNFSSGLRSMLIGYLKKIVIADFLGTYVNAIYGDVFSSSGASLLIATFFFALQIYGDFSGYSDIAIGIARIMGIRLSQNFDHPYRSKSVREFYRRWHITLNRWFIDYLYIPLGGSRRSPFRHVLNILIVFLVSGFWHGARWNFVLWGVLNGIFVVLETLLDKPFGKWKNKKEARKKIIDVLSVPFTFLLLSATWVFFRSPDVETAFVVYQRIFTSFRMGKGLESFTDFTFVLRVVLSITLLILLPYLPKLDFSKDRNGQYNIKRISSSLVIYVALIFLISYAWASQLATGGESGFIYFQF